MALGKNLKKRDSPSEASVVEVEELVEEPKIEESHEESDEVPEEDHETKSVTMMCVFKAGGEEYAFPIDAVSEVVKHVAIAPVPQMPNYIIGMVNVRGNIYSVLDLASYFGSKEDVDESYNFLVVINDEEYKVAIQISGVPDTLQVSDDMIENFTDSMLKSIQKQEFLKGIIKKDNRMIILLNILDMISSENFVK